MRRRRADAGSGQKPASPVAGRRGGRATHLATLLAVWAAAAQLQLTTGRSAVAGVLALAAGASLATRRRVHFGSAGEVLALLAFGVVGLVVHGLAPNQMGVASAPLGASMSVFAFTGLAMAALRLHLERPEGGVPATLAAAGVVFLACGTVRTGVWLPRLFGAYALVSLGAIALNAWWGGRAPAPWRMRGRSAVVAVALLAAVPLAMFTWGHSGPRLIRSGTAALLDRLGPSRGTGFHDGPITLHALDGLRGSDEVVLRVDGPTPEYLRGNVYTTYSHGRWLPPAEAQLAEPDALELAPPAGTAAGATHIEYAGAAGDRFFLPLGAALVAIEPAPASVDAWRVVRSTQGPPVQATLARRDRARSAPTPPTAADVDLPDELRDTLRAAAVALVPEPTNAPSDRARALASALATRFEYSLEFREAFARAQQRRPRADPLEVFLEDVRAGHCEYFASALVLMLRAEGVPARFVTGYRVIEHNPVGHYAIVRERHAHAWVEASLPGEGWVTLDGTPLAGGSGSQLVETPPLAAWLDWAGRAARQHGPGILLVALVLGLASAQGVRLWRGRARAAGSDPRADRRVARALRQLLDRLAHEGMGRTGHESLESLARRLRAGRSAPSPDGDARPRRAAETEPAWIEAADLIERYAAHRYGDLGSWPQLEQEIAAWPGPSDEAHAAKAQAGS